MKRLAKGLMFTGALALGVVAGYLVVTNDELRHKVIGKARSAVEASREKMDGMSEEMAVHTARVTNNPKITQDWIAHQWEALDY